MARTLNDTDLQEIARRIANNAIQSAEASNKAAVHVGHLFCEHVYIEALAMLRLVVVVLVLGVGSRVDNKE